MMPIQDSKPVRAKDWGLLIGRLLIALYYMHGAFAKLAHFDMILQGLESRGLPFASVLLVSMIAIEILGATSLALGYKPERGALLLAAYTLLLACFMHAQPGDRMLIMRWMRDLALIGGLVLLMSDGPGRLALSSKERVEE